MSNNFLIVEFTSEKVVDIISSAWLCNQTQCYFPCGDTENYLKKHISPNSATGETEKWELADIRISAQRGL